MDGIYRLLMTLFLAAPLIQAVVFIFTLGALVVLRRRWESSYIPFSLFISAGFFLLVGLALSLVGNVYPIFLILQLVLIAFGLLAQKADRQLHWRSFPFAVLIYFFTVNQFSQVNRVESVEGVWGTPESVRPFLIQIRLPDQKEYYWEFSNEKLHSYLPARGFPTVVAKYTLIYKWGGLHGVRLDTLAGQNLSQNQNNEISFMCESDCDLRGAFPKIYFMARGLDGRYPTGYTYLDL